MARSHSIHVVTDGTKVRAAFTVRHELCTWYHLVCKDPNKDGFTVLRCGDGVNAPEPEVFPISHYVGTPVESKP